MKINQIFVNTDWTRKFVNDDNAVNLLYRRQPFTVTVKRHSDLCSLNKLVIKRSSNWKEEFRKAGQCLDTVRRGKRFKAKSYTKTNRAKLMINC